MQSCLLGTQLQNTVKVGVKHQSINKKKYFNNIITGNPDYQQKKFTKIIVIF